MINVTRNGTQVILSASSKYPIGGYAYPFTFECGNEPYARLLEAHFRDILHDAISSARREEYERGWKDHRQKKTKQTWFKGTV